MPLAGALNKPNSDNYQYFCPLFFTFIRGYLVSYACDTGCCARVKILCPLFVANYSGLSRYYGQPLSRLTSGNPYHAPTLPRPWDCRASRLFLGGQSRIRTYTSLWEAVLQTAEPTNCSIYPFYYKPRERIESFLTKADGWNWTYNLPLTGRLLYQLSYVGILITNIFF